MGSRVILLSVANYRLLPSHVPVNLSNLHCAAMRPSMNELRSVLSDFLLCWVKPMGAFTTLRFYRPTKPPVVTGRSLTAFVEAFRTLGLVEDDGSSFCLKFGESIDRDNLPVSEEIPLDGHGILWTDQEIAWDVSDDARSLSELAQRISRFDSSIYRAQVRLGGATNVVWDRLHYDSSADGTYRGLELDTWSLVLEPIMLVNLGDDCPDHVGWISIDLAGYGCLAPRSLNMLMARAETLDGIQELERLCRSLWPIQSKGSSDSNHDWSWGVCETD